MLGCVVRMMGSIGLCAVLSVSLCGTGYVMGSVDVGV